MLEELLHVVLLVQSPNRADDMFLCPFNVFGGTPCDQSWIVDGVRTVGPVLRRQFTMFHHPNELFPQLVALLLRQQSGKPFAVIACGGNRVVLQSRSVGGSPDCHRVTETVVVWRGVADIPGIQSAVLDPKLGVVRYITKPAPSVAAQLTGVPEPSFEDRLKNNIRSLRPACLNVLSWHTVQSASDACSHSVDVAASLCRGHTDGNTGDWSVLTSALTHIQSTFSGSM